MQSKEYPAAIKNVMMTTMQLYGKASVCTE